MSAQLEYNSQANEASQENGFPEDFDEIFNEGFEKETAAALLSEQEAAAAALLAPEPQAENGQVDEEVDANGFPADFHVEFDEEFEKDKRNAAAAPVAPVLPVAPVAPVLPVAPVAPVVLAPQPRTNDALVKSLNMTIDQHGMLRSKLTIAQMQQAREQAATRKRERRMAAYRASGRSKEQAICLD